MVRGNPDDEDYEPVALADEVLATSLTKVKQQLLDAIMAENPLLDALKQHGTWQKPTRRTRLRRWLGDHWPEVHFGPCNHEDCY